MAVSKRIKKYNIGITGIMPEIKAAALKESPFRFYRGTCHLFVEDFVKLYNYKPKVKTWICGDIHFENAGAYKGDDRQIYFDINDFDEAVLASPEPELCRFLTSIIIAAGQMQATSINLNKALYDLMDIYTETMQGRKAKMLNANVAEGDIKLFFSQMSTIDRNDFIAHHTIKGDGNLLLIKTDNVHYFPMDKKDKAALFEQLGPILNTQKRFAEMVFEDAAIRVAGTGSLGLDRFGVLFFSKKKGKHYMIDIKQTRLSCYGEIIGIKQPRFKNDAARIIETGYLMQYAPPDFMASFKAGNKLFIVKELQPKADKMSIDYFKKDFVKLVRVAKEIAKLIAYAQLRSSGNLGASNIDELVKFTAKSQWQKDIIDVSATLADKNNKYYKAFLK